jgi:hypothetical protein
MPAPQPSLPRRCSRRRPPPRPHLPLRPLPHPAAPEKPAECAAATDEGLQWKADKKGDERKAFMKTCLSTKKTSQQDKMKACNKDAEGKKGDERKKFMSECLKVTATISR